MDCFVNQSGVVEAEAKDGTKFRGPLDIVIEALQRYNAMLASRSPAYASAADRRQATIIAPARTILEPQGPDFLADARSRLWVFLDQRRPFTTPEAIEIWAGKPLTSRVDGQPNNEYHRAWNKVVELINVYSREHRLQVSKFRSGRGAAYRLDNLETDSTESSPIGKENGPVA